MAYVESHGQVSIDGAMNNVIRFHRDLAGKGIRICLAILVRLMIIAVIVVIPVVPVVIIVVPGRISVCLADKYANQLAIIFLGGLDV